MTRDEQIKSDIIDELKWDPRVQASDIGVTVKDGAVTLTGTVKSFPTRTAAEQAAKRVKGVRAIAEEIHVRLIRDKADTDDEIARRIAHVLDWNIAFPDHNIIAEVSQGHVKLTGDVDWQYQRSKAMRQVAEVRGVVGITNNIRIRPRATDPDVKRAIASALHRHATVEASKIDVAIVDGKVTLSGDVDGAFEKDLIEDAVWSAPGVMEVFNHLRVG
ncbi:MAG: BON domain-containing protein [Geminicoccaceae bacterium]